ncbi:hypothetical protein H8R23_14630 [Flavobacterium sp. F-380]|uniref:DUF4468 domain-containing protein n=1 Tax=Flavobacterium kayseriense TaxID=2764714 RepID=A0ABR7JBP7_9FLAO|nr:hypothetical protein [Flavobacterium kayseriense]MBC5842647.1 hypothetical protein [Flavobacterium kayseriense]MBC5849177.1 hypothetical protein [Flavobacterium kayseriense]
MKKSLLFVFIIAYSAANAQYSRYYYVDHNVNANIKGNVNVSGNVNVDQTISTIDYGKLALANAEREKTRLENQKYSDQQEMRISLEIAANPAKAYDYGKKETIEKKGKVAKLKGFKSFKYTVTMLHKSMFVFTGNGRFENVSADGITTAIIFFLPTHNKEKVDNDVEKKAKMEDVKVGELNEKMGLDGGSIFVHKKDTNRATVFGEQGFNSTLIWEDDYQYTISDNYISINKNEGNGVFFSVKVRYYGDKDEVTFEQIEGRRYYLKRLVEKLISTARVWDMKY